MDVGGLDIAGDVERGRGEVRRGNLMEAVHGGNSCKWKPSGPYSSAAIGQGEIEKPQRIQNKAQPGNLNRQHGANKNKPQIAAPLKETKRREERNKK